MIVYRAVDDWESGKEAKSDFVPINIGRKRGRRSCFSSTGGGKWYNVNSMANLIATWNDPDLAEKAKRFFLDNYREIYPQSATSRKAQADSDNLVQIADLTVDHYPQAVISSVSVRYLLRTQHLLNETLRRSVPKEVSAEVAATIQIRRSLLAFARSLLYRLSCFLMMDSRVTVNELTWRTNGDQLLEFDDTYGQALVETTKEAILCNAIFPEQPINSMFVEELSILSNSIAVFFSTFDTIYDIKAIRECRIGFEEYLQNFGRVEALAAAENCLRRMKTMYLEIIKPKEVLKPALKDDDKLKELEDELAKLVDQMEKNTAALKKFDRRQTDFLAKLKKVLNAFVRLFRPGLKPPARESLVGALAERYEGLERIKEPHRSQIKAVVDLTYERPIARELKHKDDFTLAAAAKVVWESNHKKWELIKGSYETYEQFKGACYNLREKDHDPFHYKT